MEVQDLFERQIGEGNLQKLTINKSRGDHYSLSVSNWLFVTTKRSPLAEHVPFTKDEDPMGELERMATGNLIRSEDNIVRYYMKDGDTTKYVHTKGRANSRKLICVLQTTHRKTPDIQKRRHSGSRTQLGRRAHESQQVRL